MKKLFTLIFIFTCFNSFTQKKILDHSDFDIWNRIQSPQIASEGNHILYSIQTGEKESKLMLKDKQGYSNLSKTPFLINTQPKPV